MHPETAVALAGAHRTQLLDQAATSRLAAEARRHREAAATTRTPTHRLCTRPLSRADSRSLASFVATLAPKRYLRHLVPFRSAAQLRSLAEPLEAGDATQTLGAFDGHGQLVAVARYARNPIRSTSAELSIEVVPRYRRRGVGRRLLQELSELALGRGITRFTLTGRPDCEAVLRLAGRSTSRPRSSDSAGDLDLDLLARAG
jgi:GNAT superfamily N-acetyltransferase